MTLRARFLRGYERFLCWMSFHDYIPVTSPRRRILMGTPDMFAVYAQHIGTCRRCGKRLNDFTYEDETP